MFFNMLKNQIDFFSRKCSELTFPSIQSLLLLYTLYFMLQMSILHENLLIMSFSLDHYVKLMNKYLFEKKMIEQAV